MTGPLQRRLFTNAHIFVPDEEWPTGWLLTEGRHIRLLGPGGAPGFPPDYVTRQIDCAGCSLLPGFIDLHVHGAVGYEAMHGSLDGLRAMARFYARHGTTAFLPSTWTAPREATLRALHAIAAACGPVPGGATIVGAHLEGPYLNPAKCGAQDVRFIRRAERGEALEFLESGVIRLLALAPEYAENHWLIEECVRRGIRVSAAHTTATYADIRRAVEYGLRQATHSYNAMVGLSHREPGTVGAILDMPEIHCELIADKVHVHPAAIRVLLHSKGPSHIILITDAIGATGLDADEFRLDERLVTIRDGAVHLPDGTLAGSILTMDRALRNVLAVTELTLNEAWPMMSLNAARAIGLSADKGSLEVGKDADLVVLDGALQVRMTVAQGEIVYEAGASGETLSAQEQGGAG